MRRLEQYIAGCAAYIPEASDPADNIRYYRAARGLQAAWGQDFCDTFNSVFHRAFCEAGNAQEPERQYAIALDVLREWTAAKPLNVREPYYSYGTAIEPLAPTEADARAEFNRQWKAKYPGKRCNSKEANARYAEISGKAMEFVQAEYQDALKRYREVEAKRESENAKRRQEWLDVFHGAALCENAVRDLLTVA